MKTRLYAIMIGVLTVFVLSACGTDPELLKFRNEVDSFCTSISEIDTSINNVNPKSEYAISELLRYLDDLDKEFQNFAKLDFPEEYDYLESVADEASEYMTIAVANYHEAYNNDSYNESSAEFAKENYSRAYKRIQIIISFLHGDELKDADSSSSAE